MKLVINPQDLRPGMFLLEDFPVFLSDESSVAIHAGILDAEKIKQIQDNCDEDTMLVVGPKFRRGGDEITLYNVPLEDVKEMVESMTESLYSTSTKTTQDDGEMAGKLFSAMINVMKTMGKTPLIDFAGLINKYDGGSTLTHSCGVGMNNVAVYEKMLRSGAIPEMASPEEESRFRNSLVFAGLIHDLGKTRVSRSVIMKKGALTKDEFAEVMKHPAMGLAEFDIFRSRIGNEFFEKNNLDVDIIMAVIALHHMRADDLNNIPVDEMFDDKGNRVVRAGYFPAIYTEWVAEAKENFEKYLQGETLSPEQRKMAHQILASYITAGSDLAEVLMASPKNTRSYIKEVEKAEGQEVSIGAVKSQNTKKIVGFEEGKQIHASVAQALKSIILDLQLLTPVLLDSGDIGIVTKYDGANGEYTCEVYGNMVRDVNMSKDGVLDMERKASKKNFKYENVVATANSLPDLRKVIDMVFDSNFNMFNIEATSRFIKMFRDQPYYKDVQKSTSNFLPVIQSWLDDIGSSVEEALKKVEVVMEVNPLSTIPMVFTGSVHDIMMSAFTKGKDHRETARQESPKEEIRQKSLLSSLRAFFPDRRQDRGRDSGYVMERGMERNPA